jgi:heat shock protein HslJ
MEPAAPSYAESMESLTYYGIFEEPVTLSEGRYEGEPYAPESALHPAVSLLPYLTFGGDLTGDGVDEAVTFLNANTGGTGNFLYLAVVAKEEPGLRNLATAFVGDRVQIRNGIVEPGRIVLEVVQAGPNDGMCCPTQLATREWTFENETLVEGETRDVRTMSLDALADSEWRLEWVRYNAPVPDFVEITLTYADGQFTGSGGCNRFSVAVEETDVPGYLRPGAVIATDMACDDPAMSTERQYFEALRGAIKFGFHHRQLTITYETFAGLEMLIFNPVED